MKYQQQTYDTGADQGKTETYFKIVINTGSNTLNQKHFVVAAYKMKYSKDKEKYFKGALQKC